MKNLENVTVASIEQLADAVRKIAPNVWEVTVHQQCISAWSDIIACVIFSSAMATVSSLLTKKYQSNGEDGYLALSVIGWIITGFACILSLFTVASSVVTLLNPEYAAMLELARMLIK